MKYPKASIIVATINNSRTLRKTINGILSIDYPGEFEIIIINDGSTDDTKEVLEKEFSKNKKIKIINFPKNQGVCRARNSGIKEASGEIVVNMDHDCIPKKDWLTKIAEGFDSHDIGVVSSYGYYGGTSTAFRKELLDKVGGYDEDYFYYREDTDLSFSVMDLGYKFKLVKADYFHDHEEAKPRGMAKKIRYLLKRWRYHMNDVLLYKKHPKLAAKFLDVKLGFIINPLTDFKVATGKWNKGRLNLSSPRGITFLENKTIFHTALIICMGLLYVIGVKTYRLMGSLKFRKLLI